MKLLKSESLIVYIPIILAPIILFSPVWVSGNVLFWGTPFLQFMPWRELGWSMILNGHLPLWNPWLGMGTPLSANLQSAFFYPPNWLLFAMDSIGGTGLMAQGQTILVIAHIIWAGIGMARLACQLGLNRLAQAIAGLSFCLSGYLVARAGFLSINAAVAWLPWIILCANRFVGPLHPARRQLGIKVDMQDILRLSLCLGIQLLAGHAQTSYFTILLLAAWVTVWSLVGWNWKPLIANLVKTGVALILAIGLAAIQLLPTAEYLLQSQRATSVDFEFALNYSFLPLRFLTLIAPYLFGSPVSGNYLLKSDNYWEDAVYIGLLPLLLGLSAFGAALIAVIRTKKVVQDPAQARNHSLALFFGLVAIGAFILALGRYSPVFPFLYRYVPTVNMFQAPTRFSILSEFALCLLAGIGANAWQRPEGKGLAWTRRGMAVAFALLIGAGAGFVILKGVKPAFIQGVALAGLTGLLCGILAISMPAMQNESRFKLWTWAVLVFIGIDLLSMGWGLNPGTTPELYQTPSSVLSRLQPMLGPHRLYISSSDETQLKYDRFFTFNNFSIDEAWQNMRNSLLPDANVFDRIPSTNNFDPVLPARYSQWMTTVDYAEPQAKAQLLALMDVGVVELVDKTQPLGIKFISQPDPSRLRWMGCALAARDGQDAKVKLFNLVSGETPGKVFSQVILETPSVGDQAGCESASLADLKIVRDEPDRIDIITSGQSAGWLMLADSWYPGWEASIDGQVLPIYRADYLFRAIRLPSGMHKVSFSYRPISFYVGLGLSILAGLILLGLLFLSRTARTEV